MKIISRLLFPLRARHLGAAALILTLAATVAHADVVFEWNEALARCSADAANALAPHIEVRAYAMAHLAMDEAIVEATRGVPAKERRLATQRAAAASAVHAVLAELMPARAAHFEALAAGQLAAIPEGTEKNHAMKLGRASAALVLSRRDRDGWIELAQLHPPGGPTPARSSYTADALLAGAPSPKSPWLDAKPFIMKTAGHFAAVPPYTITREGKVLVDHVLRNATMFAKVDRAAAAAAMERNWAGRPFVMWNRIARSVGSGASLDLAGEARLLAVLNLALADATLSVLHWRYELGSWHAMAIDVFSPLDGVPPMSTDEVALVDRGSGLEPELIRRGTQRVLLPPVSNFPAPVATLAGAAQAAIGGVLKGDRAPVLLPEENPAEALRDGLPPRVFANVTAAARECAFVASLDGRHTREACVAGYELGEKIGAYVAKRAAARR